MSFMLPCRSNLNTIATGLDPRPLQRPLSSSQKVSASALQIHNVFLLLGNKKSLMFCALADRQTLSRANLLVDVLRWRELYVVCCTVKEQPYNSGASLLMLSIHQWICCIQKKLLSAPLQVRLTSLESEMPELNKKYICLNDKSCVFFVLWDNHKVN